MENLKGRRMTPPRRVHPKVDDLGVPTLVVAAGHRPMVCAMWADHRVDG